MFCISATYPRASSCSLDPLRLMTLIHFGVACPSEAISIAFPADSFVLPKNYLSHILGGGEVGASRTDGDDGLLNFSPVGVLYLHLLDIIYIRNKRNMAHSTPGTIPILHTYVILDHCIRLMYSI